MDSALNLLVCSPTHPDALALEQRMQAEYVRMYGEPDQDPDNHISKAHRVVILLAGDEPVGLCAWSVWPEDGYGKVRLMYVVPEARGYRLSDLLLRMVETQMRVEGITDVKFETGPAQQTAMRLYERNGYSRTSEGFGFYANNPGSAFYVKRLAR